MPVLIQGGFVPVGIPYTSYFELGLTGRAAPITQPTCSVTGTTVSLGQVLTTQLPSVGATSPISASSNIRLSCAAYPVVNMRMITAPLPGTPNVLAVTGGASGVGVQLLRNNAVVAYNSSTRVSNAAPDTLNVAVAARYYRTGDIKPGRANATAVLQFTYQ